MDIMELGAIGELVGGVAVIGSLIFVGLQIRMNAKAVQLSSTVDVIHSWVGANDQLAENADLATLVWTSLSSDMPDVSDLEQELAGRLGFFFRAQFQRLEAEYVLRLHDLMNDELWTKHLAMFRQFVRTPAGLAWWQNELTDQGRPYTQGFIAAIEGGV